VALEALQLHRLDEADHTSEAFSGGNVLHTQAEFDVALHLLPREQHVLDHHAAAWLDRCG
jgi:hypothetical protein